MGDGLAGVGLGWACWVGVFLGEVYGCMGVLFVVVCWYVGLGLGG